MLDTRRGFPISPRMLVFCVRYDLGFLCVENVVNHLFRVSGRLILLLVLIVSVSACGANRESALAQGDQEILKAKGQGNFVKTLEEAEALWEGRQDRSKLEGAIAKWEEAATLETPDMDEKQRRAALAEIFARVTQGYYFLADSHIRLSTGDEDVIDDEMKAAFEKGITAAEKGLAASSPEFAKLFQAETPWPEAIKVLEKNANPLLYWYASNTGKWALLEGFAEILSRKDDIKAIMDRVEGQSPTYYHGAPYRYFGVYYTKLPFPGGDLPKSEGYFNKAFEANPGYLATSVLMADALATKKEKKDEFEKHLQYVLDFDLAKAPGLAPENHFEKIKAQRLMDQIGDRF